METYKDNLNWSFETKKSFRVIIVGAGIAGLTSAIGLKKAGHDVVILEQVREIAEVGAGIQMAPNSNRILGRFGILDKLVEKSNVLEKNSLRRWENDAELGTAPLMPKVCSADLNIYDILMRCRLEKNITHHWLSFIVGISSPPS
jgi:salicylate hydroxylase